MATFTYTPDYGASYSVSPRVRVTRFDDGYEQRQANGLNTLPTTWSLRFSFRSDVEANDIESFLIARGAVESFDWTNLNGVSGKYVCRDWSRTKERYNLNTIECKFEQVFEP